VKKISFRNDVLPLKNQLYRLALRITLNPADAEDVVQDIFLRVADSDIPPKNDNYLLTAVRNACLNRIRQMQVHDKVKGLMPIDDEADQQPIDKRLERLDDIAAYVDEQLEEPHRSIFHLRFDEDLTVSKIARRLGLNPNTVYKYLMQSIQQIRHHFEKQ
jgi:RNA polymerase sigma factor (sigma-70 family)